jgi:hypothetical protein
MCAGLYPHLRQWTLLCVVSVQSLILAGNPLSVILGTNFADKLRSLGRYSSVGTSHMSDNRQMSVAMQQLVDFIITIAAGDFFFLL